MKKISFFLIFIIVLHNTGEAQLTLPDTTDPFMGNYILEGESELILQYAGEQSGQKRLIYDYIEGNYKFSNDFKEDKNNTNVTNISAKLDMDVTTGDFDGDNIDEIVSAWECSNSDSIFISIPIMKDRNLKWDTIKSITVGPLNIHTMSHFRDQNKVNVPSIQLISGNFDCDPQKEFVLSFYGKDEKLHIIMFETDASLNIKKLDEIKDYALQDEYIYDIAAGDFNQDGIDEIILMNPTKEDYNESIKKYELSFKLNVYQNIKNKLSSVIDTVIKDIQTPVSITNYTIFPDVGKIINIDVTTGDINADGTDEVIYGFVFEQKYSQNDPDPYSGGTTSINYSTSFLMNTFSVNNKFIGIERLSTDSPEIMAYTAININTQMPITIKTYDLDLDGTDEIVAYACNFIEVYNLNNNKLSLTCKNPVNFHMHSMSGRHMMVVGNFETNIDFATYIVVIDFDRSSLTLLKPVINSASGKVTSLQWSNSWKTTIPDDLKGLPYNSSYVVAIGDFNGDGLRLGRPQKYVKKEVIVPNIIMSAPPSHYDIFGTDTFNINNLWPKPFPLFEISYTEYNNEEKKTDVYSTTSKQDWGVSVGNEFKFKFLSGKMTATINAGYKGSYSKEIDSTHNIEISKNAKATLDDKLFGIETDYYLYEYPAFSGGKKIGEFLFSIPDSKTGLTKNTWYNCKDLDFNTFFPQHEYGNLLSYPSKMEELTDFDMTGKIFEGNREDLGINNVPTNSFKSAVITKELGTSSWELSAGFEIKYKKSIWTSTIKGDYSYKRINSFSTSIEDNFAFNYMFNKLNDRIMGTDYLVTPCIYRSKSGTLIIDYIVELTGEWWDTTYGQKPDLAFIMPYHYDQEKYKYINPVPAKSTLTSDIRYFPYDAKAGDTITIMATVRNFCLNDFNKVDSVNVHFYMGDPDEGGVPIGDIDNNNKTVVTYYNIGPRSYDTKLFRWKTPNSIPPGKSFIFGVIDSLDEIHHNNNKGWIRLFNEKGYPYTETRNYPTENYELSNYPNPASKETTIRFNLEKGQMVWLNIYDILGQKIEQQQKKCISPGWQYISLNLSAYKPGIYFYELVSDNYRATSKMIVE